MPSARVARTGNGTPPQPSRYGPAVIRILAVALAAATLAGCGSSAAGPTVTAPPVTVATKHFAGGELTPPHPAPAIALHDAAGRPVKLQAQRGRYVLVTFIYVHCPDVCPLITANLNAVLRALPAGRRTKVRVLAVSVDPKGDTPAAVRAYARRKHLLPQFEYLIGSRRELRRVWSAWRVLAVESKPDLVDHVAYTALVDTAGNERVIYDSSVHAAQVLHDLRVLMR
jgi:protein SCO1